MLILEILMWAIGNLVSYSLISWAVWIAIAFVVARYFPWWCIPIGHLIVGAIVVYLDVRWIQAEMRKPDWYGIPDQDAGLYIGTMLRTFFINTTLLPVNYLGVRLRKRQRKLKMEHTT